MRTGFLYFLGCAACYDADAPRPRDHGHGGFEAPAVNGEVTEGILAS